MILNTLQPKSDKELAESFGKLNPSELLLNSCNYGNLQGVQLALDKGADPSYNYNWALRLAAHNGHKEIVELLLNDKRVDPSPLDNMTIRMASRYGHVEVVKILLKDGRVDPSASNNYAIKWASAGEHKEGTKTKFGNYYAEHCKK